MEAESKCSDKHLVQRGIDTIPQYSSACQADSESQPAIHRDPCSNIALAASPRLGQDTWTTCGSQQSSFNPPFPSPDASQAFSYPVFIHQVLVDFISMQQALSHQSYYLIWGSLRGDPRPAAHVDRGKLRYRNLSLGYSDTALSLTLCN